MTGKFSLSDSNTEKIELLLALDYPKKIRRMIEVLKSISKMAHKYAECLSISEDIRAPYSPRCPRCITETVLNEILCPECKASQIDGAPGTKIGPQVSCAACDGTGLKNGQ
jgi:hypothetical protein